MFRSVLVVLPLCLCGCVPGEPLSPDFAGGWVGIRDSCAKGGRIELSTRRITVSGDEFPITLTIFSVQKAEVSGSVAHLTLQLEPSLDGPRPPTLVRLEPDASTPKREIRVTLTARNGRIAPSNIRVRESVTGQFVNRSREEEVATTVLTLQRCSP